MSWTRVGRFGNAPLSADSSPGTQTNRIDFSPAILVLTWYLGLWLKYANSFYFQRLKIILSIQILSENKTKIEVPSTLIGTILLVLLSMIVQVCPVMLLRSNWSKPFESHILTSQNGFLKYEMSKNAVQPTSQNGFLKHEMSKNAVQPLVKHENAKHKYGKSD